MKKDLALYLIEILHQTTTSAGEKLHRLQLYLIEILHQTTTPKPSGRTPILLYLIEILHQTTTPIAFLLAHTGCILSKFYIKPQPILFAVVAIIRCILSKFYIKPQLTDKSNSCSYGCILSKFYIKPQHRHITGSKQGVVSYRNSTSNHNYTARGCERRDVVSYRNSTSNHNSCLCISEETALYLIEILHQTTTFALSVSTQTGCILSKFYIKPQPSLAIFGTRPVVSYRNSTSNHNLASFLAPRD